MGKTSSEVKNRWCAKTYKRITVLLRKDDDAETIAFVEKHPEISATDYFRAGVEVVRKQKNETK